YTFAGNSRSGDTITSPAFNGSTDAATLMPYVVFTMSAISSGTAPIIRAHNSRDRPITANCAGQPTRQGSVRRLSHSASARTVRAGMGPVLAWFRYETLPSMVQG